MDKTVIELYQNKRNFHKYLEVKHTKCGHFYVKQYIKGNNGNKGYTGVTLKRVHIGTWHRWKWSNLKELLKDYKLIRSAYDYEVEKIYIPMRELT